jgi:hypothetical protein
MTISKREKPTENKEAWKARQTSKEILMNKNRMFYKLLENIYVAIETALRNANAHELTSGSLTLYVSDGDMCVQFDGIDVTISINDMFPTCTISLVHFTSLGEYIVSHDTVECAKIDMLRDMLAELHDTLHRTFFRIGE